MCLAVLCSSFYLVVVSSEDPVKVILALSSTLRGNGVPVSATDMIASASTTGVVYLSKPRSTTCCGGMELWKIGLIGKKLSIFLAKFSEAL